MDFEVITFEALPTGAKRRVEARERAEEVRSMEALRRRAAARAAREAAHEASLEVEG